MHEAETRALSLFMFLPFIFRGVINFSSQRAECCLVPLCFFPLSQLSLIYFLVFSLITTVSRDIIKSEWVTSHLLQLLTDVLGSTLSITSLCYFGLFGKKNKIWDTLPLDLTAQLWTILIFKNDCLWNFLQQENNLSKTCLCSLVYSEKKCRESSQSWSQWDVLQRAPNKEYCS